MRVAPIKRTYRYEDEDGWGPGRMFANYCASCVNKLPANYNPPGTSHYDYDYRRETDRDWETYVQAPNHPHPRSGRYAI